LSSVSVPQEIENISTIHELALASYVLRVEMKIDLLPERLLISKKVTELLPMLEKR